MRRTSRSWLLVATVLAAVVPATANPATAATTPPGGGTTRTALDRERRAVTLVTGDRVTVNSDGTRALAIEPATGREKMHFLASTVRGHLRVIPADAAQLVAADKVDARLFDMTTLVRFRYDDRRDTLPLMVGYGSAAGKNQTSARVAAAGGKVGREVPGVATLVVMASRNAGSTLWNSMTESKGTGTATTREL